MSVQLKWYCMGAISEGGIAPLRDFGGLKYLHRTLMLASHQWLAIDELISTLGLQLYAGGYRSLG